MDRLKELHKVLDETIQTICTIINSQRNENGVVCGWTILVDERYFSDGEMVNSEISLLAPFDQPNYITECYVREMFRKMDMPPIFVEEEDYDE